MAAKCTVCSSEDREQIDQLLLAGLPLRQIAARFNRSKDSIRRHRVAHVSVALAGVVAQQRASAGPVSALDRVELLIERVGRVLDAAEQDGQAKLILDSVRELRALVELLAKINGELREAPQVAIVLTQSDEWQRFAAGLLSVLEEHAPPELEQLVLHELQAATTEPPRPEAGGQGGLAASGLAHSGRGSPGGGEAV